MRWRAAFLTIGYHFTFEYIDLLRWVSVSPLIDSHFETIGEGEPTTIESPVVKPTESNTVPRVIRSALIFRIGVC